MHALCADAKTMTGASGNAQSSKWAMLWQKAVLKDNIAKACPKTLTTFLLLLCNR